MAARRAQPVQRSGSQGLRGNRDACHPRRGVVGPSYGSFAFGQARKLIPSAGPLLPSRHCDSRAEVARQSRRSFSPARFIRHRRRFAGKLSPPNPLRSRWRLCRLTDAACPLRVLRWASAGAPITASANGAGGDADPVFASSVQPTAAMSPRFWGAPGAHPRPFLSHRVGGAGGASDKNPAKPPSKKRPAPGASRQADGAPRSSRPTSSAQAADRSLPRKRESSFPPLCLLSPPNPLRWASAGAPLGGRILSAPTGLAVGRPSAGLHSPS